MELRAELVRLEGELAPDSAPLPRQMLDRVRAALDPDTVLFSFHLGGAASWLWALNRDGLELYRLPPKHEIEPQISAAVEAIRKEEPQAAEAGARLYDTLFGPVPLRLLRKTRWLLALDEALLDVPVPALVEKRGPNPAYVAEHHTTEVIPGAGYWVESNSRKRSSQPAALFVGVGDPIYNTADERRSRRPLGGGVTVPLAFRLSAASHDTPLVLPRLVGSGNEVDACAAAWKGEHTLLKGAEASRIRLQEQLKRNPAVVHFATHVVQTSGSARYGLIALSLTDRDETEFLQPLEIARWRIRAGLVVLSGCHSAVGARPWTGLAGLTRAWLSAGVESVVASRWDTPDEDGAIFHVFYGNLSAQKRRDPVEALREAQIAMIRAGGWRAKPRYWGAYFVVGSQ